MLPLVLTSLSDAGLDEIIMPGVEKIIMPGKLAEPHARYEDDCDNCHKTFRKAGQNERCLDCHIMVASDVRKKVGFHGLSKKVKEAECEHCHADHKGRSVDMVSLDMETFDHKETDYPLKDSHLRVDCSGCHNEKLRNREGRIKVKDRDAPPGKRLKHRDAPSGCIDCHKDDEPHKGRLGKKCKDCHDAKDWHRFKYDHKKTKFPLMGKHEKVACDGCHPNQRWKKTPLECFECHGLNDVHEGRHGKKCGKCHSSEKKGVQPKSRMYRRKGKETNWSYILFDHEKSGFKLTDKHEKAACDACHLKEVFEKRLPRECFFCHRIDDAHKGRYGRKCETCHTARGWREAVFDHKKTEFPLEHKHEKVRCDLCHRGPIYGEKLGNECYGCHQPDDAHKGQEGRRCDKCHNVRGWSVRVFFEHDITRFPLIGMHAIAACEACHPATTYRDTPMKCVKCHEADDDHKGKLGPACGRCHNPNGWALWRFDHNEDTDFDLEEKHKDLQCHACHRIKANKINLSMDCVGCHEKDDVHHGGFGRRCDRCHVPKEFREIKMQH